MKGGQSLLIAHGSDEEVMKARGILDGTGAEEVRMHIEGSE